MRPGVLMPLTPPELLPLAQNQLGEKLSRDLISLEWAGLGPVCYCSIQKWLQHNPSVSGLCRSLGILLLTVSGHLQLRSVTPALKEHSMTQLS